MYQNTAEITAFADEMWSKIEGKMEKVVPRTIGKIPYIARNGVYDDRSSDTLINSWTNGFWSAWMWLLYVGSKKDIYMEAARKAEDQLDAALQKYDKLDHDVGFLWHISSGVNYRLTKDEKSRNRTLFAASTLASRYNETGRFIRAWNGEEKQGWAIIDCMMNLPLLYWASEELQDPRFAMIAKAHADTTMENHIRKDGSVRHIVIYDYENGGMLDDLGGQGYEKGSSWSRGQSWGLYGFVLNYNHTGKQEYLDTAKRIANYFIASVADTDYLPLCDFRAPLSPVLYDSTAGAIASCGLIELAKILPENEGRIYINAALKILEAMNEKFCNWDQEYDSILQYGTEAYANERGRHQPIIYGDYYMTQAIYKLKGFGQLFE